MGESPSAKAPLKFPTPLSLGYFLWALHKLGTRFCSRCPWQSCTPGLVISNTGPECGWAPENKNSHGSIILIFCACLWHVHICIWSHTSVALWASGGCSSSQDTLWSSLINYWQCTCHNPSTCAGSFPWAWKIQAKNDWFPLLISLMTCFLYSQLRWSFPWKLPCQKLRWQLFTSKSGAVSWWHAPWEQRFGSSTEIWRPKKCHLTYRKVFI